MTRARLMSLLGEAVALQAAFVRTVCPQTPDTSRRMEIGGTVGMALIAVAGAQTGAPCHVSIASAQKPALGLRAGYRLKHWLVVEGTVELVLQDLLGGPSGAYVCP